MATASYRTLVGPALSEHISNFRSRWSDRAQRRACVHQTMRELNGLTDRELHDLGLSRSSISQVAHEVAR